MTPSNRHIPELDGLRGLLALWVCVTHLLCLTGFSGLSHSHLWESFIYAQPAVEVFMILSGFAIASLLGKPGRSLSWWGFMRGRFWRIVPVYAVCLALAFATMHLTPFILSRASWGRSDLYLSWTRALSASELGHPLTHLAAHLTLLHGVVPRSVLPDSSAAILPPAWSISLEWQFYLLAPVLVVLLRSWTGRAVVALVCVVGAHYASHWQNPQVAFLPGQLPLFLLGIASHRLYQSPTRLNSALALLVLPSAYAFHWCSLAVTIWCLCFGCAMTTDPARNPVCRLLLNRAVQATGRASYSLYLIHWPLVVGTLALCLWMHPGATPAQALGFLALVGLPAIAASTYLLHRYVEVPLMRRGKGVR